MAEETPMSPSSFDFFPGSAEPENPSGEMKTFRFAGAPDGPLPSIPSGGEDDSDSEPEIFQRNEVVRRRKSYPKLQEPKKTCWDFPFLSCFACILSVIGGITFAISSHKVTDLILKTLMEVLHTSYVWLEAAEILSTAGGALTAALSILVFSAACISVYHNSTNTWPQLIFMGLMYPLLFLWGLFVAVSFASTFVSAVLDRVCYNPEIKPIWTHWNTNDDNTVCQTINEGEQCINCIDLYPFHSIFPPETRKEDMWICGREIYLFCDEDLPSIVTWWIICLISSLLTFLGICMHLHDLSWHRTTMTEEKNLKIKHELQYIRHHVKSAIYNRRSTDVGLMLLSQTQ